MNDKYIIRLEGVATGYRSRGKDIIIGEGYNATLPAGKLTCLLGVNGSGKSTLLRTLSKSQDLLEGKIFIGDKDISSIPNSKIGKLIGLVLTDRVDSPNMTVYDLVSLGRAPYTNFWGSLQEEDRRIVDDAMRSVGIEMFRDRKVCSLSDGERQKAMVAKTLAQQTPIILLDEPTAFLDYPSKIELMKLMKKLAHEQGKAILLSTHDIPLAIELADHIWHVDSDHKLTSKINNHEESIYKDWR